MASSVADIIKRFGGPTKLARRFGLESNVVRNWRLRQKIPGDWHLPLLEAAAKEGIKLTPSELSTTNLKKAS